MLTLAPLAPFHLQIDALKRKTKRRVLRRRNAAAALRDAIVFAKTKLSPAEGPIKAYEAEKAVRVVAARALQACSKRCVHLRCSRLLPLCSSRKRTARRRFASASRLPSMPCAASAPCTSRLAQGVHGQNR